MSEVKGWLIMAIQAQPDDSTFEEIIHALEIAQMLKRDTDVPDICSDELPRRVSESLRTTMNFHPAQEGAIQRALEEVATRKAETATPRDDNIRRGLEGIRDEETGRNEGHELDMDAEPNSPAALNDSPFTPEEYERHLAKTDEELEAEDQAFTDRVEGPRA